MKTLTKCCQYPIFTNVTNGEKKCSKCGKGIKSDYEPIPVEEAKMLSEKYSKDIVIINAFDVNFGLLHTTTYGISELQKHQAAKGGELTAKILNADIPLSKYYEDFRVSSNNTIEIVKQNIKLLEDNTGTKLKETILNDLMLLQKSLGISVDKKPLEKEDK